MTIQQFIHDIKHSPKDALDTIIRMLIGAAAFTIIGYYIPEIYYHYFDTTNYYQVVSPATVENKQNISCTYVNVYLTRKALVPITGESFLQLTLINQKTGMKTRVHSFIRPFQTDKIDNFTTIVVHFSIPCNIPLGTYILDATMAYKVRDIPKTTSFYTEDFEIIATPESALKIK